MLRIAIHSVPRSGSTWLGEIFNSHPELIYKYQPLFSYAFKGQLTPHSNRDQIAQFFSRIASTPDDFTDQVDARRLGKAPVFIKSDVKKLLVYKEVRYHHIIENLLNQDNQLKVIGIVRNPFAVINSWLNAGREFRKDLGWNELEEWRYASKKNLDRPEEFNGYEKWKEVSEMFLRFSNAYPGQFKLVLYRNLIEDTETVVKDIFNFCGIGFSAATKQFIRESKSTQNNDSYGVYKIRSVDDEWKLKLPKPIVEHIARDLEGTQLDIFCK